MKTFFVWDAAWGEPQANPNVLHARCLVRREPLGFAVLTPTYGQP